MTNIYEQHDKAFNRVSAFVVARDGGMDGGDWTRALEKAGFQVWQAV